MRGTIAAAWARLAGVRRTLLVVGIGPGHPDQLTVQAVKALRRIDVVFLLDKGGGPDGPADLNRRRRAICEHHLGAASPRFVEVPDPPRDRAEEKYVAAVDDWTRRRAALYHRLLLEELPEGGVAGVLVWGDPSLYDATLRIVGLLRQIEGLELTVEVIPGITSPQALAARHGVALNQVGRPLQITTGRRLADGWPEPCDDVVVMLDGIGAYETLASEVIDIYWGANLGTEDEVVVSGPLAEVAPTVTEARRTVKARCGWVMDTYLLRRRPPEPAD